jgi:hypothetical protein
MFITIMSGGEHMQHIGLVSCVSKKQPIASPAKDLYDSPLFKKARRYIEQHCESWFILSAKYGLVDPFEVIEPYEETLNTKKRYERTEWAEHVWKDLCRHIKPGDRVTILAGQRYREFLEPRLVEHGCQVEVPMRGLRIGFQLQWLSRHQEISSHE